jgi:hypothetical protein
MKLKIKLSLYGWAQGQNLMSIRCDIKLKAHEITRMVKIERQELKDRVACMRCREMGFLYGKELFQKLPSDFKEKLPAFHKCDSAVGSK